MSRCDDCQSFNPAKPEIEERPERGRCDKDGKLHKAGDSCPDFAVWLPYSPAT